MKTPTKPKHIFVIYKWIDRDNHKCESQSFYYNSNKAFRECNISNSSRHCSGTYFVRREFIC